MSVFQMNEPYDYLFKFLVIGSAGTGKSCILHQFIGNTFKEDSSHTIGCYYLFSCITDLYISYHKASQFRSKNKE